jgi:hypothetical protein
MTCYQRLPVLISKKKDLTFSLAESSNEAATPLTATWLVHYGGSIMNNS